MQHGRRLDEGCFDVRKRLVLRERLEFLAFRISESVTLLPESIGNTGKVREKLSSERLLPQLLKQPGIREIRTAKDLTYNPVSQSPPLRGASTSS